MTFATNLRDSFPSLHDARFGWLPVKHLAWKYSLGVFLLLHVCHAICVAEPVPVRYKEGSIHGFLALRTMEGKVIAEGDLVQVSQGDRVTSELVFRFRDGSLDSDVAVFSQHDNFRADQRSPYPKRSLIS
jgi:hypothetical protein